MILWEMGAGLALTSMLDRDGGLNHKLTGVLDTNVIDDCIASARGTTLHSAGVTN